MGEIGTDLVITEGKPFAASPILGANSGIISLTWNRSALVCGLEIRVLEVSWQEGLIHILGMETAQAAAVVPRFVTGQMVNFHLALVAPAPSSLHC